MDQATSSVRETAAFARRVVLRTLTVVGGAAAGTAIAWCLSTAAASADTGDITDITDLGTPQTSAIPVVETIVSPVSGTLASVADRLPDPPRADPLEQLGERVEKAANSVTERAKEQLPECAGPLCGLDGLGRSEAPAPGDRTGLGRSDSPSPAPAAAPATPPARSAAPAGTADPGADPDDTAERTATGRAYSGGMSRRGSPAPGVPSLPDFPNWPAPAAPPAPGHNGSTAGPADSSLFAALPWQDRTPALVRGLTVPATEVVTVGRVGAQPGVTPD